MKLRYRVQVTPNRRGWANTRVCPSFVFKGTLGRELKTLSTRTARLKSTANLVYAVFHWSEVTRETGIFAEKIKRPGVGVKLSLESRRPNAASTFTEASSSFESYFFRKLYISSRDWS